MRPPKLVSLVLVLFATASLLCAQENGANTEPEPYTPEEFPRWARDLRRGEIIALGSFPLVLLFSNVAYDAVRFGRESLRAGEWNYTYAPWFFGPPDKPPLTEDERVGVILTAAGISVSVALVDFIIGRIRDGNNGNAGRGRATDS
ncbi:MAG: hypothetical protein ACQETQ_05255 [Spirochaetota bacterium]